MFYIKQFFSIFRDNLLKGTFFFLISFSFVLISGNWKLIKEKIFELYPDYAKGPSFFALISSDQDYLNIQRKLVSLPGISSVMILEKDEVKEQTKKLVENFQLKDEDLGFLNFIAVEVIFDKNITVRGQELIRNYLIKLAGENNVTLGKINFPPENDGIKSLLDFINIGGEWAVALIFGFMWFFALFILRKEVKKSAYLIEQFQRKNFVEIKILISGTFIFYLISSGLVFLSRSPEWINVFLIGFFFLISLIIKGGKHSWGS
jgi:hypothetical protein